MAKGRAIHAEKGFTARVARHPAPIAWLGAVLPKVRVPATLDSGGLYVICSAPVAPTDHAVATGYVMLQQERARVSSMHRVATTWAPCVRCATPPS